MSSSENTRLAILQDLVGAARHEAMNNLSHAMTLLALIERRSGLKLKEFSDAKSALESVGNSLDLLRSMTISPSQDEVFTEIEMGNIVDNAFSYLSSRNARRFDLRTEPEAWVMGSESSLTYLVINLLLNALKLSPSENKIRVYLQARSGKTSLSVKSFFEGKITDLDGIFDDNVTTRADGMGIGYGLAMAREATNAVNGSIEAIVLGKSLEVLVQFPEPCDN